MNLLQIYIHNGELLYLKEGFPEPPSSNEDDYKSSVVDGKWVSMVDAKSMAEYIYKRKLQSSIDKALRFEDSQEHKLLFLNAIPEAGVIGVNKPANLIGFNFKDGAYKLPDGWRVVEQWQRKLKNGTETWRDEPEIAINHYKELKYQTRLIACLIPSKVNTTASDKTGYNEERRCRLGLEILKKHIRGDFYSTGHLHMKIYEAMEEYASQFKNRGGDDNKVNDQQL